MKIGKVKDPIIRNSLLSSYNVSGAGKTIIFIKQVCCIGDIYLKNYAI